jgi:hypothetical protein
MAAEEVFEKIEAPAPPPAPPKEPANLWWLYLLITIISLSVTGGAIWFLLHPKAAISMTGINLPTVDPLNTAVVQTHMGEVVTLEGTVTSVAQSALLPAHYVLFSDDKSVVRLSISFEAASGDQLKALVGKRIRALGRIETRANILLLEVNSFNDIKPE